MSINLIRQVLHRLHVSPKSMGQSNYSTSLISQRPPIIPPQSILASLEMTSSTSSVKFAQSPTSSSVNVGLPMQNNWNRLIIIDNPSNISNIIKDMPKHKVIPVSENNTDNPLELPSTVTTEKLAARLIVIRRRKMKKHKRRKLRKRMKYVWRKIRQRRELKKEKAFQAELLGQIREAEDFDAKAYVDSRLKILDHVRLPNKWRGEILPESMIKQFLKEKEEKRQKKRNRPRITLE